MLKMKDKRISLSTDLIEGMKSIKYLCWETIFDKKIMDIRRKEYLYLTIIRIADGFSGMFWNCINYILLFVFLISYINLQHITNVKDGSANIFEIIALFGNFTIIQIYRYSRVPFRDHPMGFEQHLQELHFLLKNPKIFE